MQCKEHITRGRWIPVSREFKSAKAPAVSLSKKLYPYCLELVGSRNGFDRYLHTK